MKRCRTRQNRHLPWPGDLSHEIKGSNPLKFTKNYCLEIILFGRIVPRFSSLLCLCYCGTLLPNNQCLIVHICVEHWHFQSSARYFRCLTWGTLQLMDLTTDWMFWFLSATLRCSCRVSLIQRRSQRPSQAFSQLHCQGLPCSAKPPVEIYRCLKQKNGN